MNRPMLVVVAVLVLAGLAILFIGGPPLNDRIESAANCSELLAVLPEIQETGSQSVLRTFQARGRELGCSL